ncbi:MAG: hypothetical protein ACTS22_08580 [Phycisphaerales bacterium]
MKSFAIWFGAALAIAGTTSAQEQCDHAAQLQELGGYTSAMVVERQAAQIKFDIEAIGEKTVRKLPSLFYKHVGPCEVVIVPQDMPECPPLADLERFYSETTGFEWAFSTSVEGEVSTSLVVKLLVKLELEGAVGLRLVGSNTTTESIALRFSERQCWDQEWQMIETTYDYRGSAQEIGETLTWIISFGPNEATLRTTTKCDDETAKGAAKQHGGISIEPDHRPCCEGPGPDGSGCCGCVLPN